VKKLRFCLFSIILCLIVISTLIISCSNPTLTPTNPSASYPAQITGNVIISNSLKSSTFGFDISKNPEKFWIVNVTFTNKGYTDPEIRSWYMWSLVSGNNTYLAPIIMREEKFPILIVPLNQTAESILCFQVPNDLNINNTWLRYELNKSVSFGKLSGGKTVPGYDWESKSILNSKVVIP
jgi:hypothetical protein